MRILGGSSSFILGHKKLVWDQVAFCKPHVNSKDIFLKSNLKYPYKILFFFFILHPVQNKWNLIKKIKSNNKIKNKWSIKISDLNKEYKIINEIKKRDWDHCN